jgi:hypothetical protein
MSQEKPKPELPDFLRELDRVEFVRKPAPTGKSVRQERVIYDVNSLDELFDKAKRRGLLPDSQTLTQTRAPSPAGSQHPAFSGDDEGFLGAPSSDKP